MGKIRLSKSKESDFADLKKALESRKQVIINGLTGDELKALGELMIKANNGQVRAIYQAVVLEAYKRKIVEVDIHTITWKVN